MPYPLFDYTPESVIHTMGSSCPGGVGAAPGPTKSGYYHIGDYNYICDQKTQNCKGKNQNVGKPTNCRWTGRGYPIPGSKPYPK